MRGEALSPIARNQHMGGVLQRFLEVKIAGGPVGN